MSLNGGLGIRAALQNCLVWPCFLKELFANLKYQGSAHQTLAALDWRSSFVAWGDGPQGPLGSGMGSSLTSPAVPVGPVKVLQGPEDRQSVSYGFPSSLVAFLCVTQRTRARSALVYFPRMPLPGGCLDE